MMVWVAVWRLPEIRSIQTQLNPFPRQWTSPRSGLSNRRTLDDRKFLFLLILGWPREGTAASGFPFPTQQKSDVEKREIRIHHFDIHISGQWKLKKVKVKCLSCVEHGNFMKTIIHPII